MKHFGIIGKPLVQSFSARFFNQKFTNESIDAEYSLYPLEQIADVKPLLQLDGLNVTIPYKVAVMDYLDALDETASEIGAVNVIHQRKGYNTDAIGFINSIQPMLNGTERTAVVLGSGGASKACAYGLRKLGIEVTIASRSKGSYPLDPTPYDIIVNATPLGMYPDTQACPDILYQNLTPLHIVFDCIYNPEQTEFLRRAQQQGSRTQNGMNMLYGQAHAAARIWGIE